MDSDKIGRWTFRGNYDEQRLDELKAAYEALGFSVKTAPMVREPERACTKCMAFSRLQSLYTKKFDSE